MIALGLACASYANCIGPQTGLNCMPPNICGRGSFEPRSTSGDRTQVVSPAMFVAASMQPHREARVAPSRPGALAQPGVVAQHPEELQAGGRGVVAPAGLGGGSLDERRVS